MSRKFVPQLPSYLNLDKLQYKLDENGKEIKFSTFGKQSPRLVSKHKASGHGYKHTVNKSSKPSPTHETGHVRVVAMRSKRLLADKK